MGERVQDWWARRQFSKGLDVPYPVGAYREAWAAYPVVRRQYLPDLNGGIVLSQIPPAAEVMLLWVCESGHRFAATPAEQRARPGRTRRRSAWCPECTELATGRRPGIARPAAVPAPAPRARGAAVCLKTPPVAVGDAFRSDCAPAPASKVEPQLRDALFARLQVSPGMTAVRVSRPFFDHLEVWPDILLPELRVAVEYDSTGRHGLEHIGNRETADRRKDRLLRAAGWEVVRIRTGQLVPLGPYDLQASTLTRRTIERVLNVLREIRGPLVVDAYLAPR